MLPFSVDNPMFVPGPWLLMAGTFGMVAVSHGLAALSYPK